MLFIMHESLHNRLTYNVYPNTICGYFEYLFWIPTHDQPYVTITEKTCIIDLNIYPDNICSYMYFEYLLMINHTSLILLKIV